MQHDGLRLTGTHKATNLRTPARSKCGCSVLNRHAVSPRKAESKATLIRSNMMCAQALWGEFSETARRGLRELSQTHGLSVAKGDLLFLGKSWYITHSGLLRVAHCNRCAGIKPALLERLSDPAANRWVFRATVYKTPRSRGFVGYGDADPSNVSPLVRGAEMRVAETRAVNRALRKAYGIGLCSVEELGYVATAAPQSSEPRANGSNGNGAVRSEPRMRDRLCLLIRQHNLDPSLVKAYAADFCGTPVLKDASRERVEAFIAHLAQAAKEDRDALICELNSYAHPAEAKS